MNNELERIWNEGVVVWLEALFQLLTTGAEENQDNLHLG
jgi:hypothetical protein